MHTIDWHADTEKKQENTLKKESSSLPSYMIPTIPHTCFLIFVTDNLASFMSIPLYSELSVSKNTTT